MVAKGVMDEDARRRCAIVAVNVRMGFHGERVTMGTSLGCVGVACASVEEAREAFGLPAKLWSAKGGGLADMGKVTPPLEALMRAAWASSPMGDGSEGLLAPKARAGQRASCNAIPGLGGVGEGLVLAQVFDFGFNESYSFVRSDAALDVVDRMGTALAAWIGGSCAWSRVDPSAILDSKRCVYDEAARQWHLLREVAAVESAAAPGRAAAAKRQAL